jgi:predicted metal-dependent hydrolase
VFFMTIQVGVSLAGDRATYQRGRLRSSFQRLRTSPLFSREIWDQLREYDRPDFHPDDRDTTELVEFWREALFGTEGSMNHRLPGGSSAA